MRLYSCLNGKPFQEELHHTSYRKSVHWDQLLVIRNGYWNKQQTFDSFETRNSNYDKNIKDEKNKNFNIINLSDEAVHTKKTTI